ncbi:uncharacterized protein [Euphorbia lathyris]|uniref:uncharacterized protein isoform X2 n=1 Tax=Euphorbia lathyris TaxID=212925 RepID=UPI0033143EDD
MKILLSSAWLPRDLGFSYLVVDASRCKRLLENGEATFMDEGPWTVMTCCISKSKWKQRRMQNASFAVQKKEHLLHLKAASLADSSPASIPLPLRVEPKPKSGIRQQDLLKKVVEVKPKRARVSNPSDASHSTPTSSNDALPNSKAEVGKAGENAGNINQIESEKVNTVKSLLGLAYASSDDDEEE